jgi:aspartyl/asparaginyl beta-hydroxylase (cupin superfamily)
MADVPDDLVRKADGAAARGEFILARQLLDTAAEWEPTDIDIHLKRATMSRASGNKAAALKAADAALALEPLHFVGLLLRASLLEAMGVAEAGEAYGRALAQKPDADLPAHLQGAVDRGQRVYDAYRAQISARLKGASAEAEVRCSDAEKARVARFHTNMLRQTRVYHSEPAAYHYPGLVEREFHDRSDFSWLDVLEASTDAIEAECMALLAAERSEITPYVQYPKDQPLRQWQALNHSRDWSACHLIRNGQSVEANARHCPTTMALLARLPQPAIPGISPNAMFSLLAPGAHIPPHTGVANTRLVCHLPLIVPDGCWFRVGADTRPWQRGKAWVFDDTIEHEAANESNALRVILIFDLWHPGLSDSERAAVAAMVAEHGRQTDIGL